MVSPWHFGNTTVRNPSRIRDGLIVLNESTLHGNLIGKKEQALFAKELDKAGVINLGKQADFFGRKWRSCFYQLGFITHKFTKALKSSEFDPVIGEVMKSNPSLELSGLPFDITPSGLRMIKAESIHEQQECMLRSLLAYEIPSIIEPKNGDTVFKPFIFILQVLKGITAIDNSKGLSKVEMGIIQTYRNHTEVKNAIEEILRYRNKRNSVVGRVPKRKTDKEMLIKLGEASGVQSSTINDYADVNFRYSRFTGLLSYQGKRLIIKDDKLPVVNDILEGFSVVDTRLNDQDYLAYLWKGASLPTDNAVKAVKEIRRFKELLLDSGVNYSLLPQIPDTDDVAELNQIRLRLEVLYQQVLEKQFAANQLNEDQILETIAYLKKIDHQHVDLNVEIDDPPAYLEWAVWRAFLSINNLVNEPHEARRFKVDQDFFPVNCAPGGGPDLIFEFDEYVLVVEVTLTTSSRQEAAEGEPVRRHVAKEKARISELVDKPVYGLFIARSIDNNTAETFRIGVWYNKDVPDFINIVPITLKQFISFMEKYQVEKFDNSTFRQLLDMCLIPRNAHAPAWKSEIDKVFKQILS